MIKKKIKSIYKLVPTDSSPSECLWKMKAACLQEKIHHKGILNLQHRFWPKPIITFPPVKRQFPVVLSHQNQPKYLFRTVFPCKQCLICEYFSPDSDDTTVLLEEAILWMEELYLAGSNSLKLKCLDGFVYYRHPLFDWLEPCGFLTGLLWCFYQLLGLSFWRHPFTAEDSLVSKWYNAKFLQICSDEEKMA